MEVRTDEASALMPETPSAIASRITVFHVVVVVLSLIMTIGAWQFSIYQIKQRTELRFEAASNSVLGLISERMQRYEDALWSGVAAIESHGGDISFTDWHEFAGTLRIEEKYPGINGIGVIHFLDADGMEPYLERQRRERPAFRVHPPHDQREKMPISYIEPENINAEAIGLDVAHEQNRRTAAMKSRDTGTAQITGPIVLVQDAGNTPGFLFYAPFYQGQTPDSVEDRRARAVGAVYAPFVVRNLVAGLLAKDLRMVRFSIRDDDQMIYDEHGLDDPRHDPDPMFAASLPLDLYGRIWTIDVRTDLDFRAENTLAQPTLILIGGLLIEILIISLLVMMSRANTRAVAYADTVTASLREEKQKLARSNEELEKFAYVTSHDLKTPIRGIGGLTEMLQEDLEDYTKSPDANPEVAANLGLIQERVARMHDLTRGVLEYSRIGVEDAKAEPVVLSELIDHLIVDFSLAPEQLVLVGGDVRITKDPLNFRRVIENLVSNAVKYHPERRELSAKIEVERRDPFVRISVTLTPSAMVAPFARAPLASACEVSVGLVVPSPGIQ